MDWVHSSIVPRRVGLYFLGLTVAHYVVTWLLILASLVILGGIDGEPGVSFSRREGEPAAAAPGGDEDRLLGLASGLLKGRIKPRNWSAKTKSG